MGCEADDQVFKDDINRLLSMEEMWNKEGRTKPTALDYDSIMAGTFPTPPLRPSTAAAPAAKVPANGSTASETIAPASTIVADSNINTLKDQRELSLKENLELFVDR